jgi:hypothetical protein
MYLVLLVHSLDTAVPLSVTCIEQMFLGMLLLRWWTRWTHIHAAEQVFPVLVLVLWVLNFCAVWITKLYMMLYGLWSTSRCQRAKVSFCIAAICLFDHFIFRRTSKMLLKVDQERLTAIIILKRFNNTWYWNKHKTYALMLPACRNARQEQIYI